MCRFSPLDRETCSVCRGRAKARLSAEASRRRSSAAPPRATLARSTRERHLKDSRPGSGVGPLGMEPETLLGDVSIHHREASVSPSTGSCSYRQSRF